MTGCGKKDACAEGAEIPEAGDKGGALDISHMAGHRLDYALGALLPHLGLRGRRRCLEAGGVLVNGKPCRAAYRVCPGDRIALAPKKEAESGSGFFPAGMPRLVQVHGEFCFFFKPAGWHTVTLAGGNPGLEGTLPRLLREGGHRHLAFCRLLQRLDHATSGLVCGALSPAAEDAFRAAEAAGRCEKRYVALLTGRLPGSVTAQGVVQTDNRATSRVTSVRADPQRWTDFLPLRVWQPQDGEGARVLAALAGHGFFEPPLLPPQGMTLAACRIRRGARHQIRAHAAALGYPLWGDVRYGFCGQGHGGDQEKFFLHHGGMRFPGAYCTADAPWPLPAHLASLVREWLAGAPD